MATNLLRQKSRGKLATCVVVLLLSAAVSLADAAPYSGRHELSVDGEGVTFRHVHDWDSKKIRGLYRDFSHPDRFFSKENDFSSVEVEVTGGALLFRAPSPALTRLWISPDAQYFVGLSEIKYNNPYQLVVWRRDGSVLYREHLAESVARLSVDQRREFARRFPEAEEQLADRFFQGDGFRYVHYSQLGLPDDIGQEAWRFLWAQRAAHPYSNDFSESVTNFVFWFDSERPDLSLDRRVAGLLLSLRSPKGQRMNILLDR